MRAVYTVDTRTVRSGDASVRFVCVTDLDLGMSVTNDIEGVIDDLIRADRLEPGDRMIYRDTQGVWDEAVLAERDCHFLGFRSLDTCTCENAITIALLSSRHPGGI
jgi:hypothetical protein